MREKEKREVVCSGGGRWQRGEKRGEVGPAKKGGGSSSGREGGGSERDGGGGGGGGR